MFKQDSQKCGLSAFSANTQERGSGRRATVEDVLEINEAISAALAEARETQKQIRGRGNYEAENLTGRWE